MTKSERVAEQHETIIGANGAILIRTRKVSKILLNKAGRDGREVNL